MDVGYWLCIKWLEPNPEALKVGYFTYYEGEDWRMVCSLQELARTLMRCV